MYYSIVAETINIDHQINSIKIYQHKMKKHDDKFHANCIDHFYSYIETLSPEDKWLISDIYANGRNAAISLNYIIWEFTDYTHTPILSELIDGLSANLKYHKNKCKNTYISVQKRMTELNEPCWSIREMMNISKDICTDIDQVLNILNLLKQTKTYRLQKGTLKMDDIDNAMLPPTIQNNYSGTFQQNQFQSGANNTINLNQINNQALQQLCSKMREVIDQLSESTEVKQSIKNIVAEIERTNDPLTFKNAYAKLTTTLSNHITIFTAFASSGILTELTKYLG